MRYLAFILAAAPLYWMLPWTASQIGMQWHWTYFLYLIISPLLFAVVIVSVKYIWTERRHEVK